MPDRDLMLPGSYDYGFVTLSVVIAIVASYAALELTGGVTAARGAVRWLWLVGGSLGMGMGIGIWSMHYVGMLAFRLLVPVEYNWPTVLLSLLAGVLSSALALFIASRRSMGSVRLWAGSIFMGGGIAILHYVAMGAMRLQASCDYSPLTVASSVILAIVFSLIALRLTFAFRGDPAAWRWRKAAAALLMGAAISGMHYTGMAAATFTPSTVPPDLSRAVSISYLGTVGIATVALMIVTVALVTCQADRFRGNARFLMSYSNRRPKRSRCSM
ncbi:MAG TPA: MHYT domain-containing protein [Bryobacteraceae bacterium]|jgi:NO-binding membrane sensor protein with MHYT domain|nr:MHYT domain-containing protein [Bryobacteraceae bacterium]